MIASFLRAKRTLRMLNTLYLLGITLIAEGVLLYLSIHSGLSLVLLLSGLCLTGLLYFTINFSPPSIVPDWRLVFPELEGKSKISKYDRNCNGIVRLPSLFICRLHNWSIALIIAGLCNFLMGAPDIIYKILLFTGGLIQALGSLGASHSRKDDWTLVYPVLERDQRDDDPTLIILEGKKEISEQEWDDCIYFLKRQLMEINAKSIRKNT